jgi:Fuc2NAc and GlcNAc transferase
MGDAGSGFLGMILGLMALHAAAIDPDLFWAWLVLLGVFVVDATWTLFWRLAHGERLYEAHRDHAYQRLARKAGSHLPVTYGTGLINLLWLLPLAALIVSDRLDGTLGLGIAYLPLLLLAGFVTLRDRTGKLGEGRLGGG